MPDSSFNLDTFMAQSHTDATSTERLLLPEGEYTARPSRFIGDARLFPSNEKGGPRVVMSIGWLILDQSAREALQTDTPEARQDLWVEVAEDGVTIINAVGHNRRLGLLKEALGQNQAGVAWSPPDLVNKARNCTVTIGHRTGSNGETYAEVTRVLPLKENL